MKFSTAITAALTFGVTIASPMLEVRQNANAIVNGVNNIQAKLVALNNTLNGFKPRDPLGLITALKIQQQSSDIETAIKDTTKAVNASPPLNEDDSFTVGQAFLLLLPQVQSVLNNIVTHKPAFASAVLFVGDLSKTVKASLQSQRALSATLGAAIQKKLAPPFDSVAPDVTAELLGYFDAAIAAYDKCSSPVCLPPFPNITLPKTKLPPKPKA